MQAVALPARHASLSRMVCCLAWMLTKSHPRALEPAVKELKHCALSQSITLSPHNLCRAQKEKQYDKALETYSKALGLCGSASPAFTAVLHANRAAAFQAKGSRADAVADCLRATALDPTYTKVQPGFHA